MKNVINTLALLAAISPAYAANTPETLGIASQLLKDGKANEALELLQVEHHPATASAQEWFLMGVAAKQAGKLDDAVDYFEKVLAIDPKADRVKLELAAVTYQLGNAERAKTLLLDVKAARPPAGVVSNIDRFLATIESNQGQKNWRVRASAGWIYDSNVNAGPNEDVIAMFGLPFRLSKDAKPAEDNAYLLNLGFDHVIPINGSIGWQSNIGINWRDNATVDNLDSLYVSGSSGPVWKQNGHLIWSMPLVADWVRYGHTNDYFSFSYGLAPQVRYLASQSLAFSLSTTVRGKSFDQQSERELVSWTVTPSVDYQVTQDDSIRFGVTAGQEHSGIAYYTNDRWFLSANYFHNFSKEFIAILNTSYGDAFYQGKEAAYNDIRQDTRASVGVDLIYHVNDFNTDVVTSASYTSNDSNLAIYEYDQTQVSVNLRSAF